MGERGMREKIDFTQCRRITSKAYNGANGKKIAVDYNGATWMLKFPPNVQDRPNTQSYSNSCFSEHIGSTNAGAFPSTETMNCSRRYATPILWTKI